MMSGVSRETMKIALAASVCVLATHVQAQTFGRSQLGAALDRATFMAEGRAGTVALATGAAISSVATAAGSNSFRPVENGACYSIVDDRILSGTGRLYFAVNHNVPYAPAKNSFLAIQVIRFTASNAPSNVAVSRSPGAWLSISRNRAARPVGEGKFLGRTPEEFANAHRLRGGNFDLGAVNSFFSGSTERSVEWHARLAKRGNSDEPAGYYSSLDPALAPVWSGTTDQYTLPSDRTYQRLVRSYLISLDYGTKDSVPVVFNTDRIASDFVVVRISSAPGSGFNIDQTFSFALNRQDCLFVPSGGWQISRWFGSGR
jgi:hypothetical protein